LSVTCHRSVVFSGYSSFLHQLNWQPQYNWNIVESVIKHLSLPSKLLSDICIFYFLRLELDTCTESQQALRNLLLLVGSLTTCGYLELKPNQASSGSLYQMPGFSHPQPAGKGKWNLKQKSMHSQHDVLLSEQFYYHTISN
jgi:hypothetical protein